MRPAIETIFILFGQGENFIAKVTMKKNLEVSFRRICSRCTIRHAGKGMRFGIEDDGIYCDYYVLNEGVKKSWKKKEQRILTNF